MNTPDNILRDEINRLYESILRSQSEFEVIETLVSSANTLKFANSRYYDATICPFRNTFFYVMRHTSKEYPNAKTGYKIYDATLEEKHVESFAPCWETYTDIIQNNSSSKIAWAKDLELEKSGWVDVPVKTGRNLLGLWALDRTATKQPSPSELQRLIRLGSIAALKIEEIRQIRIGSLTDQVFRETEATRTKDEILQSCVKDICKATKGKFVAYFTLDPILRKLVKLIEIHYDDDTFEVLKRSDVDNEYILGQYLTGGAWDDPKLQYIPDFDEALEWKPALVNEGSKKLHVDLAKHKIASVIYQKIDIPGTSPGLIRIINRSDNQDLIFTGEQKAILNMISYPLANILGIFDASKRLNYIWDAFSNTLTRLRDNGLDYSDIAKAIKSTGFHSMLISVWREDGTLIDIWSDRETIKSSLQSKVNVLKCPDVLKMKEAEITQMHEVPEPLRGCLRDFGFQLLYLFPRLGQATTRTSAEFVLVIYPLQMKNDESIRHEKNGDELFWNQHRDMLITLDILARLSATARELGRNRRLLYCAEEAIGTIGHEMNTPTSSLLNIAQELLYQERRLIHSLPEGSPVSSHVISVNPEGRLYSESIKGRNMTLKWLDSVDKKVNEHSVILRRVVDNALRWARLGGESIEMDLKKIALSELLLQSIEQLKDQIRRRHPLQIKLRESVYKAGDIVVDPFLCSVLFVNLIDNAIKYSHTRGRGYEFLVDISIERQTNLIDVNITNWGLGIDRSDYDNIFSNFYRSSIRDRLHTVRGVGLGLATCKKIVDLHKGEIMVRSVPTLDDKKRTEAKEGFMTTFTIRLPKNLKPGRIDVDMTTYDEKRRYH